MRRKRLSRLTEARIQLICSEWRFDGLVRIAEPTEEAGEDADARILPVPSGDMVPGDEVHSVAAS